MAVQEIVAGKVDVVVHAHQVHWMQESSNRLLETSRNASSYCAMQMKSSNRCRDRAAEDGRMQQLLLLKKWKPAVKQETLREKRHTTSQ